MRVNPIEAVRKITADLAYYTRQIFEKRAEQQEKYAQQKRTAANTQSDVQFEQMMEKVPSHHTVSKPAAISTVNYENMADFKVLHSQYEQTPLTHQRIAYAQKAYEGSMNEQSPVTIEPFDSRA
ncbi:hypothetical protein [Paenibacillus hunanensis]|uniref:Ribosome-binding ATPase YchF (GTP1/OBG family) n=1 Tax=Paenibacillus hunanensis TaxID=539262 RepID=A0ABU1IUX2_9BACL|nr:hypothetical protein [Paenibacillus hunanensis]MDR6243028.1 ribosome-binding ATPase YchF (GTP1/OBG family) [Paenibacillus hunanensis]WPP43207.1 hypothetical protein SK066_09845 [Paenibacillus hunanensis]GGJ12524.1 hypothetical protein GCM10008022_21980 [Paenibacillus hunanensis]